MKTVQLSGIKVDDVGAVWYDLLKKEFDVDGVAVNKDGTFVYMADDEEKDVQPVVESWVGKGPSQDRSRSAAEKVRKEIKELLEASRKRRAERAAAREAEELKQAELLKEQETSAASNPPDLGAKPVSFKDGEGTVIGELMEGQPGDPKAPWYKRMWKALF